MGFIDAVRKREFKATALVYDVRITLPSVAEKSSVIVIFPYKLENRKVSIGAALAQKGDADIFRRL